MKNRGILPPTRRIGGGKIGARGKGKFIMNTTGDRREMSGAVRAEGGILGPRLGQKCLTLIGREWADILGEGCWRKSSAGRELGGFEETGRSGSSLIGGGLGLIGRGFNAAGGVSGVHIWRRGGWGACRLWGGGL